MPRIDGTTTFEVVHGGVRIAGDCAPSGVPLIMLHGLTAMRRYVVMGSRVLAHSGFRATSYDARGHGDSSPAADRSAYEYSDQIGDLEAVLDGLDLERAILVGASMGAATAIGFALRHPMRVTALVLITPAATGGAPAGAALKSWDALADGLERGGIDGFLDAYDPPIDARWRETVLRVTRQRLERHADLTAVADALRIVPRSSAFEGLAQLEQIAARTLVVGSRDEPDPTHPLALAKSYVERLPSAELIVEDPGKSPLAWQGAQLSRRIVDFLVRSGVPGAGHWAGAG